MAQSSISTSCFFAARLMRSLIVFMIVAVIFGGVVFVVDIAPGRPHMLGRIDRVLVVDRIGELDIAILVESLVREFTSSRRSIRLLIRTLLSTTNVATTERPSTCVPRLLRSSGTAAGPPPLPAPVPSVDQIDADREGRGVAIVGFGYGHAASDPGRCYRCCWACPACCLWRHTVPGEHLLRERIVEEQLRGKHLGVVGAHLEVNMHGATGVPTGINRGEGGDAAGIGHLRAAQPFLAGRIEAGIG